MPTRILMTTALMLLALAFSFRLTQLGADEVDFNRDIRPLLAKNCFACHGPDAKAREANLRLDTAAGATADLGGYRAISPKDPANSRLLQRIESVDPDKVMPPPDSGLVLKSEQKKQLKDWISAGAEYDIHWAFVGPKKSPLPKVKQADWPRSPLDRFVLHALEAKGLAPAEPANRYLLIRRLALDLTGLPPTIEQADRFAQDASGDALQNIVDELLDSDAYGEHWARMWLDLARYADTKGYEKDRHRDIWRYRDWVIHSLNNDMPYDQFTIEQLAGDLLPNATNTQILATAFHRNTMTNDEGGTDNEEFRVAAVKDRVDTTIQVWMGLTMGCAKCHSHKYDPISQSDYYSFYAFFNQTADADRGDDNPTLATPTALQTQQTEELASAIASIQGKLKSESAKLGSAFTAWRKDQGEMATWQPLRLASFESKQRVELTQNDAGDLIAGRVGEAGRPDKDDWTLTLRLPANRLITALRLDVLTAPKDADWPNHNMVLSELTAELLRPGKPSMPVRLSNPRADFSQSKWPVANAIDRNAKTGWALAPQIDKPHVAIFDLKDAIDASPDSQLRLVFKQQYGQQHVLGRFRVSVCGLDNRLLLAEVDAERGLRNAFERQVHKPSLLLSKQLDQARKSLSTLRAAIPKTPVMRELATNKQRQTRIQIRGNFLNQGDLVSPQAPELFGRFGEGVPRNRLGVARWLVQPENPLTARVMVNRVWARLFGRGIVETEEDFGAQGLPPTHPEMLDWLAVDFREQGWSLKKLLRTFVLSAAYQQSSRTNERNRKVDPGNHWFSRGPRFRLAAETVRDQALASSGLLTQKVGGPSVMPPQPSGIWKSTYNTLKWKNAVGADRYRRGIYTYWKRTSPYPAMTTFDAGSGEVCLIRRVRTNTPLQALVTLNDPAFVEAAGALAMRAEKRQLAPPETLAYAFRLVLIRPPTDQELTQLIQLYESLQVDMKSNPKASAELLKAANLAKGDAALVIVANVLLNLDETLMKP